jgi:hypothetical protein
MPLCGPPRCLSIEVDDLRKALRQAYLDRERLGALGAAAAARAKSYTWSKTAAAMRLEALVGRSGSASGERATGHNGSTNGLLSVCMLMQDAEAQLGNCLARIVPFASDVVIADLASRDRSVAIAREYGARVIEGAQRQPSETLHRQCIEEAYGQWILWLTTADLLSEIDAERMLRLLENQAEHVTEVVLRAESSWLAEGRESVLRFQRRGRGKRP